MRAFRDAGDDGAEHPLDRVQRGVVGLFISYQDYDADRPWVKRTPATRYAQAAVVDGPYLLTTAQMVAGATMVEAEREGRPPRTPVRVVHRDQELNLALLAVDAPGFFDGLDPLPLADGTPTGGTVETVRWRSQQFEVAATRVKRIVVGEVYFGRLRHAFLLGQTDLTDGGWAEPVVSDAELIGIASSQEEHTAWVVPCEVLRQYLEQARDPATYRGFAVIRFAWQWNMDAALSAWLGQEGPQEGVIVRSVPRGSTGAGILEPRDILLSLDGHPIDSCGYLRHPRFGRLEFTHVVIEGHRVGDVVPAVVLRQGKPLELQIPLRSYTNAMDLVPLRRGDEAPPYAVVGGLVFIELDGDYLATWGREWWNHAPIRIVSLFYLEEGAQRPERRRIILLAHVLPSAWSLGYQDVRDLPVRQIDGRDIDSIADVVEAFRDRSGPFVRVGFYPNEVRDELVVDATTLDEATAQILDDYGIPAAHRLAEDPLPPID